MYGQGIKVRDCYDGVEAEDEGRVSVCAGHSASKSGLLKEKLQRQLVEQEVLPLVRVPSLSTAFRRRTTSRWARAETVQLVVVRRCGGQYGCRASEQATGHTGQYGSPGEAEVFEAHAGTAGDNLISPDKPAEGWRQSG